MDKKNYERTTCSGFGIGWDNLEENWLELIPQLSSDRFRNLFPNLFLAGFPSPNAKVPNAKLLWGPQVFSALEVTDPVSKS